MSFPFVIWTMQRTGGTTLASLLLSISEHPKLPHEPFNPTRELGWIKQDWMSNRDRKALRQNIQTAFQPSFVTKHCYELIPNQMNAVLMGVTNKMGYRHIVLDRGDEVDRILSWELARVTGVWGKKNSAQTYSAIKSGEIAVDPINIDEAVAHAQACRKKRDWLSAKFEQRNILPMFVFFEDLYGPENKGPAVVGAILDFLEIDPNGIEDFQARRDEALTTRSQGSNSILPFVPNIDAARDALRAVVGQGYSWRTIS